MVKFVPAEYPVVNGKPAKAKACNCAAGVRELEQKLSAVRGQLLAMKHQLARAVGDIDAALQLKP